MRPGPHGRARSVRPGRRRRRDQAALGELDGPLRQPDGVQQRPGPAGGGAAGAGASVGPADGGAEEERGEGVGEEGQVLPGGGGGGGGGGEGGGGELVVLGGGGGGGGVLAADGGGVGGRGGGVSYAVGRPARLRRPLGDGGEWWRRCCTCMVVAGRRGLAAVWI